MAAIPKPGKVPVLLQILTIIICTSQLITPSSTQETNNEWAKTVTTGKENTTTLQFYFHDIVSGKNPTAVMLVGPSNATGSITMSGFGALLMADDLLTMGPEPTSKPVGRAQGLYGSACRDELGLIMALSYVFSEGIYNGSSIVMLGRNSAMHRVREMPVVGGTGVFRMCRGYALARTHWLDYRTGDATVGYNVTVVH